MYAKYFAECVGKRQLLHKLTLKKMWSTGEIVYHLIWSLINMPKGTKDSATVMVSSKLKAIISQDFIGLVPLIGLGGDT